ncbi:hypothetical protein [Actinophytocola sp.]|uniref:hypothetical protein n=1 Tax=Actinophytocola sp. TaxID=1872138 RepID=UPI002D759D9C|nr:hypothetical protein [Actinophytocola sp.]HYQ65614.1 hypothetical protein [Actinophytocola sp.]
MRAVFLVVLVLVAGCAERHAGAPEADGQVMPADFAGTVEYANGSVPPPYHFRWRLTFDASTAVVEWRPGYGESTPWRESVDINAEQRTALYGRLRDLGVFGPAEAMDGGMAGGMTYDPGPLGASERGARLLDGVADAVRELVPAEVWDGLKARQDDWSARQPK